MDYRHIAIDTLTDFAKEMPEMTLGEILYSCFRESITGRKLTEPKDFMEMGDKEIYIAIEKAMKDERK